MNNENICLGMTEANGFQFLLKGQPAIGYGALYVMKDRGGEEKRVAMKKSKLLPTANQKIEIVRVSNIKAKNNYEFEGVIELLPKEIIERIRSMERKNRDDGRLSLEEFRFELERISALRAADQRPTVSIRYVRTLISESKATIHRMIRNKTFPQAIRGGSRNLYWYADEIDAYCQGKFE